MPTAAVTSRPIMVSFLGESAGPYSITSGSVNAMERPRLIYYQDAHHFHAKRLDPPLSMEKLRWPVDELLGSGVDVLAFGLGYGDVYFHDSKVGRVVGQMQDVWNSYIDWRIMRMVQDARGVLAPIR